jgi:hypothetical protein
MHKSKIEVSKLSLQTKNPKSAFWIQRPSKSSALKMRTTLKSIFLAEYLVRGPSIALGNIADLYKKEMIPQGVMKKNVVTCLRLISLDRTSELRQKGYAGRRLGPKQMTTDTAVRVTRMVVQDRSL